MADIIMGSDLGLMRGSNHPISDRPKVAFSSETGTGSPQNTREKIGFQVAGL
jgi:hypothetical protein